MPSTIAHRVVALALTLTLAACEQQQSAARRNPPAPSRPTVAADADTPRPDTRTFSRLLRAVESADSPEAPSAITTLGGTEADKPVPQPGVDFRTDDLPVIITLHARPRKVIIKASPTGPLYTVEGPEGETLIANATLDRLKAEAPALYQQIDKAIAAPIYADNLPLRSAGAPPDYPLD